MGCWDTFATKTTAYVRWTLVIIFCLHTHLFGLIAIAFLKLDPLPQYNYALSISAIGLIVTPLTIVLLLHLAFDNLYSVYSTDIKTNEIQSWEISWIVWGISCAIYIFILDFGPCKPCQSMVDIDFEDEQEKIIERATSVLSSKSVVVTNKTLAKDFKWRSQLATYSLMPFGVNVGFLDHISNINSLWIATLLSTLPALISGYTANYFLDEKFELSCDNTNSYATDPDAVQFGNSYCIAISSHRPFNIYDFSSALGGSVLAGWAFVKIVAGLIIQYSEDFRTEDYDNSLNDSLISLWKDWIRYDDTTNTLIDVDGDERFRFYCQHDDCKTRHKGAPYLHIAIVNRKGASAKYVRRSELRGCHYRTVSMERAWTDCGICWVCQQRIVDAMRYQHHGEKSHPICRYCAKKSLQATLAAVRANENQNVDAQKQGAYKE